MPTAKKIARETRSRKEAPAIRPVFVSQHTAPAVLGFKNERAFLDWLPSSGCRVVERGKDRLVLLDEAQDALLRDALGAGNLREPTNSDELVTAEAVLARIGRRIGGAR